MPTRPSTIVTWRAGAAPLSARCAALTVREIVTGRSADGRAAAVAGILDGGGGAAPFVLACAHDDLGLYIRDRYAATLLRDIQAARRE